MRKTYRLISLLLGLSAAVFHNLSAVTKADYSTEDEEAKAIFKSFREEPQAQFTAKDAKSLLESSDCAKVLKGASFLVWAYESALPHSRLKTASQFRDLIQSENPYIKGIGCLSILNVLKKDKTLSPENMKKNCVDVLAEIMDSPSTYVRFKAHKKLAEFHPKWQQRVEFWEASRGNFPPAYHLKIDLAIARLSIDDAVEQTKFKPQQVLLLQRIIVSGNDDEKLQSKAIFNLANICSRYGEDNEFYSPDYAAELYEKLLLKEIIDKFEVLGRFSRMLHYGPEGIKDEARALNFYNEILHPEQPVKQFIYENALNGMIRLLANSKNPLIRDELAAFAKAEETIDNESLSAHTRNNALTHIMYLLHQGPQEIKDLHRAFGIARAIARDDNFSDGARSSANSIFIDLLLSGPEGVKDQKQALKLLEAQLESVEPGPSKDRLLQRLAHFYREGDMEVRDIEKAVYYTELCKAQSEKKPA